MGINGMRIRVKSPARSIYYPDVEGNLELPESERFGIEMFRPPRHELYLESMRNEIGTDGEVKQRMDTSSYALAHVRRLINPPTLDFGETTRVMEKGDIFAWDEFAEIASKVLERANAMHGPEAEPPKNS